jgi:NAD(P)-dependent dehydrogenase (short-subunit alcohol dehydrogenase family)
MLPLLKASTCPKFIPISSGTASIGYFAALKTEYLAYGASKAALNYLTRRIHFENEWVGE